MDKENIKEKEGEWYMLMLMLTCMYVHRCIFLFFFLFGTRAGWSSFLVLDFIGQSATFSKKLIYLALHRVLSSIKTASTTNIPDIININRANEHDFEVVIWKRDVKWTISIYIYDSIRICMVMCTQLYGSNNNCHSRSSYLTHTFHVVMHHIIIHVYVYNILNVHFYTPLCCNFVVAIDIIALACRLYTCIQSMDWLSSALAMPQYWHLSIYYERNL